jgi:hypothetical protein
MADLTSIRQTTNNSGGAITTAYAPANNYKLAAGSQFGTRVLKFIEVAAVEDGSAVDFTKFNLAGTGAYTTSESLMQKAVNALQGFGEVYVVGVPSATEFVVVIADDTHNGAEAGSNVQAATFGAMEAAIDAAIGIGTGTHSVTVTPLSLVGDDLS